jgi:hypothetical protein
MSDGRPASGTKETGLIALRCTPELIARVSLLVEELQAKHPGMKITRSDAIRITLEEATKHLAEKPASKRARSAK